MSGALDGRLAILPKVKAPVTFGFSRQKGHLLSGGRYFRMVKKRSYANNRFRRSVHVTQHEIKNLVLVCF